MQELRDLLNRVISAKRDLKEVYYTSRDSNTKSDTKELVVATISLQRSLEDLLRLRRKSKTARQVLEDRKAQLTIRRWQVGLPRRIKDFLVKRKKVEQNHLHRYQQALLKYMNDINIELVGWIEDITTLAEMPRLPEK
ncbi:MAG: hypothetical protein ACFE7R_05335 [Candidatus Hodarchaeota archaeon]